MEAGEKVSDTQATISTRKSVVVNITDQNLLPLECVKIIPESLCADKNAIKKAFKSGEVPGAELVDNINLSIK